MRVSSYQHGNASRSRYPLRSPRVPGAYTPGRRYALVTGNSVHRAGRNLWIHISDRCPCYCYAGISALPPLGNRFIFQTPALVAVKLAFPPTRCPFVSTLCLVMDSYPGFTPTTSPSSRHSPPQLNPHPRHYLTTRYCAKMGSFGESITVSS